MVGDGSSSSPRGLSTSTSKSAVPVLVVSRNPIQLAGACPPPAPALHTNRASMVCERAAAGLAIREAALTPDSRPEAPVPQRQAGDAARQVASETTAM